MSGMSRRGWWAVPVVVAAVAVLAVGCTGGGVGPNTSTVVPASSSPSASSAPISASPSPSVRLYPVDVPLTGHNLKPGERPPLYPAAARARTQDGANAFAEFFMRTLDWAYATTNPSYMKHYSGPSCGLCSGLATGISKTAAEHLWYMGGRLNVHPSTATPIGPVTAPADFCSTATVDITATAVVDKTGKIYNGQGALVNQTFKLCAKANSTSWSITYLIGTTP
jgi:hypothetical protein